MGRFIEVWLAANTSNLEKGYARAARATSRFNREITGLKQSTRAGSSAFGTLSRSLAFATGGVVAAHGITEFLRGSVDAANKAESAQASLAAQMRAVGESFQANRDQVEKTEGAYAKFGFTSTDVAQSLTVLERATGNINTAIRVQTGAVDLARASNKSLTVAANAVGKALAGQETSLRKMVPGLSKTAHGADLVRQAFDKVRGQAAANTGASQRFNSTLEETQRIIGAALLPVLNKYLDQFSKWLDKMNRSGKLQSHLNEFMKNATPIVTGLASAVGDLANAFDKLAETRAKAEKHGGPFGFLFKSGLFRALKAGPENLKKALQAFGILPAEAVTPPGMRGPIRGGAAGAAVPAGLAGPASAAATAARRGFTAAQRNQWFDAKVARELDRVQDISLRKQLARLKEIGSEIRDRIAATKDVTRRLTLQDQLVAVLRQEKSVQKEITDQINQQNKAAKDKAAAQKKAADEAAREARARQAQFGVPLGLQVGEARATALGQSIRPFLLKMKQAAQKALKSGRLNLQGQLDAWNTIADVNQQLADMAKKTTDKVSSVPSSMGGSSVAGFVTGPAPAVAAAAGAAPVFHIDTLHVSGVQDVNALEESLLRRAGSRPMTRRGPV